MSRIDLSSPIGAVIDRAYRAAVASSREDTPGHVRLDGLGEGFIAHYFKSMHAVAEALCPVLIDFVNDSAVASLLDDGLKSQIRAEGPFRPYDLAVQIVARLSNPHQTNLQAAVLAYLKSRAGTSFCFRAPQTGSATLSRSQRSFPPSLSNCPGREREVAEIVGALGSAGRRNPSVVVGGVGGIGKTTLALTALNDGAIRDRYGNRRFWINCEIAYTAETFLENVIAVLSTSATLSTLFTLPINDVDQDFLNVLDRIPEGGDPAVVAFDNLESIFDTNDNLVERVLSLVLQRAGVVVTLRGERRPSIGGIWSWPASEKTRLNQLPESAWLFAFETHAGRRLDDRTRIIVDPILQHIGGYPLAIFLLGRRLAHGQSSIDDLRQAWDSEISRAGEPDDTRQTSLIISIRTSLRSTVMVNTPFAFETLILAAHLPPGFCLSVSHEEVKSLNGLPKWMGLALCETEKARNAAWAALTRCGLAYAEFDGPDRLQLLPPVQEALCWHAPMLRLSQSRQRALLEALDAIYQDTHVVTSAFSKLDNGRFGQAVLEKLERRDAPVYGPLQFQDDPPPDVSVRSVHLLATICRNSGFLLSGRILFHEADVRYTALDNARVAMCMRASKLRLECRIAGYERRWQEEMALAGEEASLWDLAASPRNAAWAHSVERASHAQIAELEERLEHAAELHIHEAQLWEEAGKPKAAASARANVLHFRSRVAERDNQLDEAARCRDDEAPLREQAGQVRLAMEVRAKALGLRAHIANDNNRLDEAAGFLDELASLWEQGGQLQIMALACAFGSNIRAQLAEREDRLRDALEYREAAAGQWVMADKPAEATAARREVEELRRRIREREQHSEGGGVSSDEVEQTLEDGDYPRFWTGLVWQL